MAIPGQTITVPENGLGNVGATTSIPMVLGCCASSTANTVQSFSDPTAAAAALGQGPLTEAVCAILSEAGGPVKCMRLTGGTAASCGAVTDNAVGGGTGTVTVAAQVPYDAYEVIIEITTTGTLGTGAFKYSLDDGLTYSEPIIIPSGGTYLMPDTNVTLTFVAGAGPVFFVDGMTHTFDCIAPLYTVPNLATGNAVLVLDTSEWDFVALTGTPLTDTAGALVFAAVEAHATSLAAVYRYTRWLMDGGIQATAATFGATFAAVDDSRVSVCYSDCDMASSKPITGWAFPKMSTVVPVAMRAAKSLISTDLARVDDGSLTGVVAINHDERATEVLDAFRITTLRTWPGRGGFYITNARLKSAAGSDFRYWQHGRVIDVACATTQLVQQSLISAAVRTNSDGTIDERDAVRYEEKGDTALRAKLTQPTNAEGTPGHVSALSYSISRVNNVQATEAVITVVAARPLGYGKTISTTIGFALNPGA